MWRPGKGGSSSHEEPASYPTGPDRQPTCPLRGRVVRRIRNVTRATPSCRHASGDILILIDARFSSCLPCSRCGLRVPGETGGRVKLIFWDGTGVVLVAKR